MKILKSGVATVLLLCSLWQASAQKSTPPVNEPNYRKPKFFADLPDSLSFRVAGTEALLDLPVGAAVNTVLAPGFTLTGTVVSKSDPADRSTKSVVVKCPSRGDAVFSFSRITKADGTVVFRGRMISRNGGDALEITRGSGGYVLRKKGYYDMINE